MFYDQYTKCKKLFIFGYGYTASTLAKILCKNQWEISGTSSSISTDKYCNIITLDNPKIKDILNKSTHILLSIPPNNSGDIIYQNYQELIHNNATVRWIGYLSSTAIYGNHNGVWVNEETSVMPSSQRGVNRQLAENQWITFCQKQNIAINIFRLSGIYGPNRNALLQVQSGKARSINKKDHVFSRIHVFDIAQIIQRAMQKEFKNEVFNLADDYPCSPIEVNNYAALLLKKPQPIIVEYTMENLSKIVKTFYLDNKRISNRKIKQLLNIKLQFPNYKIGLNSIFSDLLYKA